MNRYNELKLQVLALFASTQGEWVGPNEAAEKLDSFPARSAWTYFKRLWRFGLLEDVPEVEEPWNTVSVNYEGRGFAGYARGGRRSLRAQITESDFRSTLRNKLRQMLRTYLTKGIPVMLREDDFNGEQKANLASALAQVGEPEDLPVLRELIRADIARRQRGVEARMRRDRSK